MFSPDLVFPAVVGGGGRRRGCWGCDRPTGRSISRLMWVPLAAAEENPSADSLLLPGIPESTSWNNSALAAALPWLAIVQVHS